MKRFKKLINKLHLIYFMLTSNHGIYFRYKTEEEQAYWHKWLTEKGFMDKSPFKQ